MATLLAAPLSGASSEPSPPPDYSPPEAKALCPALEEDYDLCSSDPWSGNCADFVTAAGRLGAVYRSEVQEHPGWADELKTMVWWGCGSADLEDLRSLLESIDTEEARTVLDEEPYRSLGEPDSPPPDSAD